LAGTLSGFAGAVRPMNIPGVQTTPGSETLFQAPDPGQVTGIAALNGVGDSMERLSEYWISLAEQSLPYIEIQAGRKIDLITQKGLALEARI
jgi:conjugal transfer pilus assembly protein TraB